MKIVYSGNGTSSVAATVHEAKYHVTASLPPAKVGLQTTSLGNLRLAEDTNTLSLTLGDGVATSSIRIHEVVLISHAP